MERVLLVEDSDEYQYLIRTTLEHRFQVICASTAVDATKLLKKGSFALILLDVSLPDSDGFQLCTQIRNNEMTRDVPTIFITGKAGINDKLMGFSLGADDYITKPFEPLELRARVESKVNKQRTQKNSADIVKKVGIKLQASVQKAFMLEENGKERDLRLTPIEFKLLWHFMTHEDHALTRNQLLSAVWGSDVYVLDRTIDKHVWSLRIKLESKEDCVQTVPGIGYRFCSTFAEKKAA